MFLNPDSKLYYFFAKIRWCFFVAIAITLIFFVVIMGTLRLVLPYLSSYEAEVESELQALFERPVNVSRIDAGWQWFSPQLKLVDVSVLNKDKKTELIRFDEVVFGFSVIESLIDFKFEPSVITLKGTTFLVHRKSTEEYTIQGITLPKLHSSDDSSAGVDDAVTQLNGKEIRLQNATVRWVDEMHAAQHQAFKNVNLSLQVDYPRFNLSIEAEVPEKIGKKVQVVGELSIDNGRWKSDIYINAKDIYLQSLMGYVDDVGVSVSSKFDTELWLSLNDLELETVSGKLRAENVVLHSDRNTGKKNWNSEYLSAVFYLHHEDGSWQAAVDDLNVRVGNRNWHDVYFSVNYEERDSSLNAYFDYIELSDISELVESLPVNAELVSTLSKVKPKGELKNVAIHIDEWKKTNNWKLSAEFKGLGVTVPNENIRVDGVSGFLEMDKNRGLINLSSKRLTVASPYFNQALTLTDLRSEINVEKIADDFSLSSKAIVAKLDSVLVQTRLEFLSGKNSFLDFQVAFGEADATWFNAHRTDELFGKEVAEWLSTAIVDGDFKGAGILFRGFINEYPFRGNEGIMQSIVDVENGVLKYQPEWPKISNITTRFHFENEEIKILESSGMLGESRIENTTTTINLAGEPHVIVVGDVETNAKEVDGFFTSTPLKQDYLDMVKYVDVGGALQAKLKIDIPLDGDSDVSVAGKIKLSDNYLKIKSYGYTVLNTKGTVDFNDTFITSDALIGEFDGNEIAAVIKTKKTTEGVKTSLLADFKADANSLFSVADGMGALFENEADWQLAVDIYHSPSITSKLMSIELLSNLEGLELSFPKPFYKAANELSDLNIKFNVFETSSSLLVHYEEDLSLSMRWDEGYLNLKSDIQINNGAVKAINEGINVTANVKQLDAHEWQSLLQPLFKSKKNDALPLVRLNFKIDTFIYDSVKLNNLSINAKSSDDTWLFDVVSNELVGLAEVPESYKSGSALAMKFKKLDLSSMMDEQAKETDKAEKISPIRPSDIPSLNIQANDFSYKGYSFDQMSLVTNRTSYGVTVHAFDLKDESLAVNVRGNWFSKRKAKDSSNFRIEIESDDVGKVFSHYGFTESIKGGSGKAIVDWQWQASPFDFDWSLISGKMETKFVDGRFVDIEPGAGRLLGMFSLGALPRRFFLDFSDTFSEGYEFDKFDANANFSDGNLYTKNARLTGNSADVYFKGRIGLADEDYNQVMSVVPRISSGVSGWIALAQGAVVGLTAYVGQKLLGVDEAAKNQYRITGSWSDPVIKKINSGDAVDNNAAGDGE